VRRQGIEPVPNSPPGNLFTKRGQTPPQPSLLAAALGQHGQIFGKAAERSVSAASASKGVRLMQSSITLGFLNNGRPVQPNRQINITDNEPGFGEAFRVFGPEAAVALAVATYNALQGNWKTAGSALLPLLKKAYDGKDEIAAATSHLTFPEGGSLVIAGDRTTVDELRVVFRAWSEDDLTTSFGKVSQADNTPPSGIIDEGESHSSQTATVTTCMCTASMCPWTRSPLGTTCLPSAQVTTALSSMWELAAS
jgi:hypothetical protein